MQFIHLKPLSLRVHSYKPQSCSLSTPRSTTSALRSNFVKSQLHGVLQSRHFHMNNVTLQKIPKSKKKPDVKPIGPDMKKLIRAAAKTPHELEELSLEQTLLGSCTGCGIKLQTLDPQGLGYVPPPELRQSFNGTKAPPADYLEKRKFELSLDPMEVIQDLKNFRDWKKQQIANKYKNLPTVEEETAEAAEFAAQQPSNEETESPSDPLLPNENEIVAPSDPFLAARNETPPIPEDQGLDQKPRDITDLTEDELLDLDLEVIPYEDFSRRNRDYPHKKLVCQRCFMLKNYGKVAPVQVSLDQFKKQLAPLR